jgi:group I intron endonuclease
MKSGIYKIEINNKIYVGRDKRLISNSRMKRHLRSLKKGTHPNKHLQNAYIKFNDFKYEIIEFCDYNIINEREIYWINFLRSTDHEFGYNMTSGGDVCPSELLNEEDLNKRNMKISETLKNFYKKNNNPFEGKSHTIESRKKISDSKLGKYKSEHNPNHRSDITNEMIKDSLIEFGSVKSAAKNLNCSQPFLSYRIKSQGFILVYENDKKIGRGCKILSVQIP